MALSGTIKDFGLGDIFQLIGIQRKTGELTLEADGDLVTIKFVDGQVVGADTRSASVEDLLGAVLVRTGRLTGKQLNQALALQKQTLQRLGFVLVKNSLINEDELIEALRVQSLQIVYRLFRWSSGNYRFVAADNLDYDEKHFVPISAESILMEGARMIDEWPIIERRIRSDNMVVRLTEEANGLDLEPGPGPVVSDTEFDSVFDTQAPDEEPEAADPAEVSLSEEERQMLRLVDGRRTVLEINDHANLGEFDTYRLLADLMGRKLIEEVKRPNASDVQRAKRKVPERVFHVLIGLAILGFAAVAFVTLPDNRWTPWRLGLQDEATETLHRLASRQRLERLEAGMEIFYLDRGTFPSDLGDLTAGGYLDDADLLDPWGRSYDYHRSSGGFRVSGLGADGEADEELVLSHRFTTVQRMMMSPMGARLEDPEPPPAALPPELDGSAKLPI